MTIEEIQERVRWAQANADNPKMHTITRNERLYDRLCPDRYATMQIASSYAGDMPGVWRLWDENAEMIAEFSVTVTPPIQEQRHEHKPPHSKARHEHRKA